MKLLLVIDIWKPFISGVVTTFSTTVEHLRRRGHDVEVIHPYMFRRVPFPLNKEFPIPVMPKRKVFRILDEAQPDAIHLATEGLLGRAARKWCLKHDVPFTSSYTTKIPECFRAWIGVPLSMGYGIMRRFHRSSSSVMVSTLTFRRELESRGFTNLEFWERGVDLDLFCPRDEEFLPDKRPIMVCVGRVAKEKNLPAFLGLDLPGTKYIVGDGPELKSLQKKYPDARFVGNKRGEELARYYAAADVMVFPSLLDTFGLVILESLASGTPVAAYPVTGPIDVIGKTEVDVLDADLKVSVEKALKLDRATCRAFAEKRSWDRSVDQFINNLRITGLGSEPIERDRKSVYIPPTHISIKPHRDSQSLPNPAGKTAR